MIIDANVFKGFYEATLGRQHQLHGCPIKLLNSATTENPIHQDNSKIIEHEWRALVDPDWLNSWLAEQFISGKISLSETITNVGLEKQLQTMGFPRSRDIWYIRLGLGVAKSTDNDCKLISEDIDFYDPSKKGCSSKTRSKILSEAKGPIAKLLKKNGIQPCCVGP